MTKAHVHRHALQKPLEHFGAMHHSRHDSHLSLAAIACADSACLGLHSDSTVPAVQCQGCCKSA